MGASKKYGTCYLCGLHKPLTKDHLPPKCFFARPRPNNLITVGGCESCNNGASRDDEKARIVIAFEASYVGTPEAKALFEETVEFLKTKRPKMLERILETRSKEPVLNSNSGRLNHTYRLESESYFRVFERTARGFYFRELGTAVPKDHRVLTSRFDWPSFAPELFEDTEVVTIGQMRIFIDRNAHFPALRIYRYEFYGAERCATMIVPPDFETVAQSVLPDILKAPS